MNSIWRVCFQGNRLLYFLIVIVLSAPASAQEIGINLNAKLSKEFDWGKKWKFTMHQRIAITPEFTTTESPYQDLFDDFDLIPGFDEDDLYDDDEEEQENDDESGLTYKIGKKQQIQFAYRYQERLNKRNRKSRDINLRYNLNF